MMISDETLLREMSQISVEMTLQSVAARARLAADAIPESISGREALSIFADAIEIAMHKTWPTSG